MPAMSTDADSQDILFRGKRFTVKRKSFPSHEQGTIHREVVVPSDAVVILPMIDAETVVLIRNERPAVGQTLWELPAGTLEPGEDPRACAARELREETGYVAADLRQLTAFYSSPGFCTERLTAYVARDLTHVGQSLDDSERIDVEPTPLSQVLDMIRGNRIRDGKTIATLLYHHAFGDPAS